MRPVVPAPRPPGSRHRHAFAYFDGAAFRPIVVPDVAGLAEAFEVHSVPAADHRPRSPGLWILCFPWIERATIGGESAPAGWYPPTWDHPTIADLAALHDGTWTGDGPGG